MSAFRVSRTTAQGRERGNVVADGGADAWSAVEPEGVATIARSRVCGTSRAVAESTGDMPISAVSANTRHTKMKAACSKADYRGCSNAVGGRHAWTGCAWRIRLMKRLP